MTETKCSTNLYNRPIIVNGHKIEGLIDIRSSCSLLRRSIAERYKMPISVTSDKVLRGFSAEITSNQSTQYEIKIMNATARVNAIVVPDSHLVYDIMVGRDFLDQKHIVIIKQGRINTRTIASD